jgi:hypothetical protein
MRAAGADGPLVSAAVVSSPVLASGTNPGSLLDPRYATPVDELAVVLNAAGIPVCGGILSP